MVGADVQVKRKEERDWGTGGFIKYNKSRKAKQGYIERANENGSRSKKGEKDESKNGCLV